MKKIEEGKYRRVIVILNQLSINVLSIKTLEKMLGRLKKFKKDLVNKKRAMSFENDERL